MKIYPKIPATLALCALITGLMTSLAAFAAQPRAFKDGDVLKCTLEGGATVFVSAHDGKADFGFDQSLEPALMNNPGIGYFGVPAKVRLADGQQNVFELVEIGDSEKNGCSLGLRLSTVDQKIASDGSIALNPQELTGSNQLDCGILQYNVISCTAGKDLKSTQELRQFFSVASPN